MESQSPEQGESRGRIPGDGETVLTESVEYKWNMETRNMKHVMTLQVVAKIELSLDEAWESQHRYLCQWYPNLWKLLSSDGIMKITSFPNILIRVWGHLLNADQVNK